MGFGFFLRRFFTMKLMMRISVMIMIKAPVITETLSHMGMGISDFIRVGFPKNSFRLIVHWRVFLSLVTIVALFTPAGVGRLMI